MDRSYPAFPAVKESVQGHSRVAKVARRLDADPELLLELG